MGFLSVVDLLVVGTIVSAILLLARGIVKTKGREDCYLYGVLLLAFSASLLFYRFNLVGIWFIFAYIVVFVFILTSRSLFFKSIRFLEWKLLSLIIVLVILMTFITATLEVPIIISLQKVIWFYVSISIISIVSLGIIAVFFILIVKGENNLQGVKTILDSGIKSLSIIFSFTLFISLFGLISAPERLIFSFKGTVYNSFLFLIFLVVFILIVEGVMYFVYILQQISFKLEKYDEQ